MAIERVPQCSIKQCTESINVVVLLNPSSADVPIEAFYMDFVLHDLKLFYSSFQETTTSMPCLPGLIRCFVSGLFFYQLDIMHKMDTCGYPICGEAIIHEAAGQETEHAVAPYSSPSGEGCLPTEGMSDDLNFSLNNKLERGQFEYGCSHYRRRCRIRAPCCNEIFDCRHCHNEMKDSIDIERNHRHQISRHEVRQVICSLCDTEQEVRQVCINCGVCMGEYFCGTCKFFDDDTSKKQYHCNGCGICRTGGRENFFHCYKCGCCYSNLLKNSHSCVEGAMHHDCPVCSEYLFDSMNVVSALHCGHTIHIKCLEEMQKHFQYACPLCSKSVCDMSKVWEKMDIEVEATPMPHLYQNKKVHILCNDCSTISEVQYHVLGQKCLNCKSYNTRQR